jgi:hypothetical protein
LIAKIDSDRDLEHFLACFGLFKLCELSFHWNIDKPCRSLLTSYLELKKRTEAPILDSRLTQARAQEGTTSIVTIVEEARQIERITIMTSLARSTRSMLDKLGLLTTKMLRERRNNSSIEEPTLCTRKSGTKK